MLPPVDALCVRLGVPSSYAGLIMAASDLAALGSSVAISFWWAAVEGWVGGWEGAGWVLRPRPWDPLQHVPSGGTKFGKTVRRCWASKWVVLLTTAACGHCPDQFPTSHCRRPPLPPLQDSAQ